MSLIHWLATTRGRWLRAAVGVALIYAGWFWLWANSGIIVALVGLTMLLSAINDVCLLAWLYGQPISGGWLRADTPAHTRRHAHN